MGVGFLLLVKAATDTEVTPSSRVAKGGQGNPTVMVYASTRSQDKSCKRVRFEMSSAVFLDKEGRIVTNKV